MPILRAARSLRIHLHVHRVFLRAEHLHLRHARNHGNPLRHHRVRVFVQRVQRHCFGSDGQINHGLVGGVHLAERRRARHAGRQQRSGLGDHGLHVLRAGVDVAAEVELDGDGRRAESAGGRHGVHPGDGGELAFQRRGDSRCHRVGIRSREAGGHHDGGELDVGQIADRQRVVRHHAEQRDGEHQQRRRDGPFDERPRYVHDSTFTREPGARRMWPSVTTLSPGSTPFRTSMTSPEVSPGTTSRSSTVWSGLRT